ncbi:MAG: hypothetical protein ACYTDX_00380 [Planctomycetota bacterium]|jgi:hypothetical protein
MTKKINTTDEPEEEEDDIDIVRALIYFLGILLVGLVVVVWLLQGKRDEFTNAVQYSERELPKLAKQYEEIRGLLREYAEGDAGDARDKTATWMRERYSAAAIQPSQVTINPWKNRPYREYEENGVKVVVKGIPRENAMRFVWNVERISTKMRTISMRLNRAAPRDQPEADLWDLTVEFGYRVPRGG